MKGRREPALHQICLYNLRVETPARSGRRRLLTVLGVTFGIAVAVGNSIGAGIFRAPGSVAAHLPDFWPFLAVWVVGGLYALLGANALSELATMVPRSGGQYAFVRRGLGNYAGFVVGWTDWLSTCGTTALVAIVLGEYAVGLFPELHTHQAVALFTIVVLTLIQWIGIRPAGAAQDLTSLLKALALLFFVGACFALGSRNPASSIMHADRDGSLIAAFILSLQAVIYTYDGWSAPIYFAEEIRDPGRNVPRAIFIGLTVVVVSYLLINVAFAAVVPIPTLAGQKLAAAAVARHIFGLHGDVVLQAVVVAVLLSAVNSNILMAPRVIYAMAKDGLFWRGAAEVNRGGTPDVALLISSILAAAFIASGAFDSVIAKLAFFFVANYTLSFITLFVMRRTEPNVTRPFRAWGHPFTTGLAVVASLAFLAGAVAADVVNSLWSIALLVVSIPLYLLVRAAGLKKRAPVA